MRANRYVPSDWLWLAFVGMGLLLSGLVACLVASSWVILPYDEALTGLTPARLTAINPHLLAFMAHDRVAFGGTLISTGLLYTALAARGVRAKAVWALHTLVISASVGFASFFLWLGFDYFDPVHALATAVIFACFVLGLVPNRHHLLLPNRGVSLEQRSAQTGTARLAPTMRYPADRSVLRVMRARSLPWPRLGGLRPADIVRSRRPGQWLFILVGGGIALAGLTVAVVGVTVVFVPEDLEFMRTTAAQLHAANPALVPLIAHDRAGFGGALLADGLGVLLSAWWGYQQGARWLWWTLLAAGIPGFAAAIGIHVVVGYLNWWHLFPALVALAIYMVALAVAYPDLWRRGNPTPQSTRSGPFGADRGGKVDTVPGLGA